MFAPLVAWLRQQQITFSENVAIGPHLYFKIGGTVSLLVTCHSAAQLAAVMKKIIAGKLPYLVIGGGSNIAFFDGLTRVVVLMAPAAASGPTVPIQLLDDRSLAVESGVRNQQFLSWCAAKGAGGLEFLSGIPGTLGGAAAVNAGAFGCSMADVLIGADIIDAQGMARTVDSGYFGFAYRDSRFKFGRDILLSLRLKFNPGDAVVISKKIRDNLEYRLAHHPSYRQASAGCFFKNPLLRGVKGSAGKIIEACGLKNMTVGGLSVAAEHGNFLLNRGNASFEDLQRLEKEIQSAVAARTGVVLEREVIYVSPAGEKY
ncbi:MAG TPA: UDP-N-acetylmuramate dehydrogenase [Patescibacteria group bacterium]|nr:UDP-N-acetylmuramate dehydrogenase [Patescibacteria group bacterium]